MTAKKIVCSLEMKHFFIIIFSLILSGKFLFTIHVFFYLFILFTGDGEKLLALVTSQILNKCYILHIYNILFHVEPIIFPHHFVHWRNTDTIVFEIIYMV